MQQTNEILRDVLKELLLKENGPRAGLTVQQAAKAIGVNSVKMYELTRVEGFPSLKLGNRIIIPVIPFLEWLDREAWKHDSKSSDAAGKPSKWG